MYSYGKLLVTIEVAMVIVAQRWIAIACLFSQNNSMAVGDHILAICTQIFAEHELSSFVDLMDFCDCVWVWIVCALALRTCQTGSLQFLVIHFVSYFDFYLCVCVVCVRFSDEKTCIATNPSEIPIKQCKLNKFQWRCDSNMIRRWMMAFC